jgi:hypothetical protein
MGCTGSAYERGRGARHRATIRHRRTQARPAAKRTQSAMESGTARSPGPAANPRHRDRELPVAGGVVTPPGLQLPHPGAAYEGRCDTERHGEEPGRVDRVPAGARDHHLVHLPGGQRASHGGQLGGGPRGQGRAATVRLVRMRRADPGGPDPTGPPRASGVLRAAPARRKCMSSVACHNIGCRRARDGEGDGEQHLARRERRGRLAQVGGVRTRTTRSGASNVMNTGTNATAATAAVATAVSGLGDSSATTWAA